MRVRLPFKILILVTGYWLLVTGLCGCQNQQLYKESRIMMGTFVEVISPDKRAADIAFSEIKRIEDLLSKYKEDSEVSKLNKFSKLNVSPDTLYIIKRAREFWLITDGAFDISVGPLMDLWGFTDKIYYLPKEDEIKKTLSLVGLDKVIINDSMIQFSVEGMRIDLGAIAKGYALDCAIKKLKEMEINSCLINAGGDIYCLGSKPRSSSKTIGDFKEGRGKPWKVAMQDPRLKGFVGYLELKDKAVATSGDYQQYFIKDNKRYSHIFNPKTGYPVDSGVISVTVIAPDCLTADALATSIFVLGKEEGQELIKRFPGVEVKIKP